MTLKCNIVWLERDNTGSQSLDNELSSISGVIKLHHRWDKRPHTWEFTSNGRKVFKSSQSWDAVLIHYRIYRNLHPNKPILEFLEMVVKPIRVKYDISFQTLLTLTRKNLNSTATPEIYWHMKEWLRKSDSKRGARPLQPILWRRATYVFNRAALYANIWLRFACATIDITVKSKNLWQVRRLIWSESLQTSGMVDDWCDQKVYKLSKCATIDMTWKSTNLRPESQIAMSINYPPGR